MPEEINNLKKRIEHLESLLKSMLLGDKLILPTRVQTSRDVGTIFGLSEVEKIGFYGTTAVSQNTSPNGKQDTSGSSGITMTTGHRFNGNTGSLYYSVGDIVYALKQLGLIDT